jgi:hypothetical protein
VAAAATTSAPSNTTAAMRFLIPASQWDENGLVNRLNWLTFLTM